MLSVESVNKFAIRFFYDGEDLYLFDTEKTHKLPSNGDLRHFISIFLLLNAFPHNFVLF